MKKIPEIISSENYENLTKIKNFIFFVSEDDSSIPELYRTQYDEELGIYAPVKLTYYPTLTYTNEEKLQHIQSFLSASNIHHYTSGNCIIILPEEVNEIVNMECPLYMKENSYFQYTGNTFTRDVPKRQQLDEAYEIFSKVRKSIKKEEILFDAKNLTFEDRICSYLERYPVPVDLYLKGDPNYFVLELQNVPDATGELVNPYSNEYLIPKTQDNGFAAGGNYLIFNKVEIKKQLVDGTLTCILPREVASVVIGKGGSNLKGLSFNLGVKKIVIVNPFPPNQRKLS